jgi:hypothetical protein
MRVEILAVPDERPDERPERPAERPAGNTAPVAAPEGPTEDQPAAAGALTAGASGAPSSSAAAQIRVHAMDNGIIHVRLPPNKEIAGAEARVAGAAVRALAGGRRVPVVLVITGVVGVSVEARQAYVSAIAASAFAVVGETPVDRVIAHYLLRSKTETIPARFFTSEAEAVTWLGQYAREH